ncbi:MAG: hypothetical protein H0U57_07030 [Tatlockia sp.]|nr:hypothetical protein [Tatlockia sp.]
MNYIFKLRNFPFSLFFITSFFTSLAQGESNLHARASEKTRFAIGVESILQSHQYIQTNKASLYWQLSPYYLSQLTDSSCSLASVTMVVNAIRSQQILVRNEPLATQNEVLKRVNDKDWQRGVRQGGNGVSLFQLETFLSKALKVYGVDNFELNRVQLKGSSKNNEFILHKALVESENTGKTFIIANFNQKYFTGDMSVGHFSPIGAYDIATKRVLIMDPDRELYEPYWVPEKLFFDSMATLDKDAGHYRGYLILRIKPT